MTIIVDLGTNSLTQRMMCMFSVTFVGMSGHKILRLMSKILFVTENLKKKKNCSGMHAI